MKKIHKIVVLIVVIFFAGVFIWLNTGYQPLPSAITALSSKGEIRVTREKWITFTPAGMDYETGIIFYPGGRVEPEAYAPLVRNIARKGYLAVIVPMPFNLAVFGAGKAEAVIEHFNEIEKWYLAGHSLGGAMAARFAKRHPDLIDGLILLASYPAADDDLSSSSLKVLSIYGNKDGVIEKNKFIASKNLLPADTVWREIEGGNHAQFGYYGSQKGDEEAAISPEKQQAIVKEEIIKFIE